VSCEACEIWLVGERGRPAGGRVGVCVAVAVLPCWLLFGRYPQGVPWFSLAFVGVAAVLGGTSTDSGGRRKWGDLHRAEGVGTHARRLGGEIAGNRLELDSRIGNIVIMTRFSCLGRIEKWVVFSWCERVCALVMRMRRRFSPRRHGDTEDGSTENT
jgi:hypothetical protein